MKGAWSIWGRNTPVSTHRSLFLFLVILPAILLLTGPLWADAWEPVIPSGAVPSARSGHSMVLIGGKVYMLGGEGNSGETAGQMAANGILFNDLWCFIEESNEWVQVAQNNPPKARKNHAAVAYGEKMHIFFGQDDQGTPLGDIWAYDVASNSWQEVTTVGQVKPGPRADHSVVAAYGHFYMFGGKDKYGNVYSDLWSCNLTTKEWNQEPSYTLPSKGHKAMANDAKMYVYGGDNGQLVHDHLLTYDFATKQWTNISTQTKPAGRTCHIATLDANKIRVSGGRGQTEELGDTWEYDIVSNQWVRKADGPVQSSSAAVSVPAKSSESMITASLPAASHILMFGGASCLAGKETASFWTKCGNTLSRPTRPSQHPQLIFYYLTKTHKATRRNTG